METIYYYKDAYSRWHFSTGAVKEDATVGQHLRMLRYAKKNVERLYPDLPHDYEIICRVFGIPGTTPWENIYNNG